VLYGSGEPPETEATLHIGDSARILGSGLMPLHPNLRCQSQATATVRVFFWRFWDDTEMRTRGPRELSVWEPSTN